MTLTDLGTLDSEESFYIPPLIPVQNKHKTYKESLHATAMSDRGLGLTTVPHPPLFLTSLYSLLPPAY